MLPRNPVSLSKTGGREKNQDCVFPSPDDIGEDDRLFIICDGVGGAAKGEVASGMVCENFPDYFSEIEKSQPGQEDFQSILDKVSCDLRDYAFKNPMAASMATTFTIVHLGAQQLTMGWVGDSRVHLIRNGKIIYHTFDHSRVGEMVSQGGLTWEEARLHPQSNIITRTVNAQENAILDVKSIKNENLQPDDYILLCSDGVIETFSNPDLEELMDGKREPEAIGEMIDKRCDQESNDNYTFCLFQLKKG